MDQHHHHHHHRGRPDLISGQHQPVVRSFSSIGGDRFIPVRSSMDFDLANYLLTRNNNNKKKEEMEDSPRRQCYQRILADTLIPARHRIFSFNRKPPSAPVEQQFTDDAMSPGGHPQLQHRNNISKNQRRYIPKSAELILDAPYIIDDYYLNLLDWGSTNVLAIALGNTVYLRHTSTGSVSELMTADQVLDRGPVTSVSWAPDGRHVAVGLNSSDVQIWDSTTNRLSRTLEGMHHSRVGALSWNGNILTTGEMDGLIANNDVRVRSHVVQTLRGHQHDVCGLKWSCSGQQLASGGNDNLVHIWDLSMSSSNIPPPGQNQWLHRFEDHKAAVRALAWCPFQSNLLASGGGMDDRCIKFWSTHTGACLNTVDTGSQVCSLIWNKNERELLSSHGSARNQLTLWKYPSMRKIIELTGHKSRPLFMAQSPDGYTVASASGDETLRLWYPFGKPELEKPAAKAAHAQPFSSNSRIHIR